MSAISTGMYLGGGGGGDDDHDDDHHDEAEHDGGDNDSKNSHHHDGEMKFSRVGSPYGTLIKQNIYKGSEAKKMVMETGASCEKRNLFRLDCAVI